MNFDLAALGFGLCDGEILVLAVESLQTGFGVGEADAVSAGVVGVSGKITFAVVADDQVQMIASLFCFDGDEAGVSLRFDAVADGVLDEWLKNESWNEGFQEFVGNVLVEAEAFAETFLFDVEIGANEFEFLREGNFLFLHGIERAAEEFA